MSFRRNQRMFFGPICLAACLLSSSTAWASLKVIATLPDYGSLIQTLGGDHVDVRVLASPLEDPHYVDAKPSFIAALHRADCLFLNGLELEIGWLPKLVVQSRNPRIQPGARGYFEVGAYVDNLIGVHQGPIDRSMGDIHGGGNPHFYSDPKQMYRLLPLFANRLMELDPENRADYETNLRLLQTQFKVLLQQLKEQFQKLPIENRKVVAYHKSFDYFFQTLGLEVVAYLEPKPGVAPTPSHVAKVLSEMKRQGIRVIVQETYYPSRTSLTLASLAGAQVVKMQGGTSVGRAYLEEIRDRALRLQEALQGGSTL